MTRYDTNLAAEFYVLSLLHRLGMEATLTLGNKKSVDIVVLRGCGKAVTLDVKGLAGKTSWPVDNVKRKSRDHFLVFLSFLGKIEDLTVPPEVYVVPAARLVSLTYSNPRCTRMVVPLWRIRKKGSEFKDAWHLLM